MMNSQSRLILLRVWRPEDSMVSRRALLRSAIGGAAGLLAGRLLPSAVADSLLDLARRHGSAPGMGMPGAARRADAGPPAFGPMLSPTPNMNRYALAPGGVGADALASPLPVTPVNSRLVLTANGMGSLINITNVLTGPGLYIGNEFEDWSDATRQQVFQQIRSWGFEWVCPKVGGYGSTWYGSDQQLRNWRLWANEAGLVFAPFIYSVPSSAAADARICSEIANDCGIAVVDMEDEWESSNGAYNDDMALFGTTYRGLNPSTPIIVTGYGDPTYAFTGWPYAQMTAWADGYSPQWYYGDWDTYDGKTADVTAAINWGDGYCGSAFGDSFPLIPSVSVYSDFSTGIIENGVKYMPNSDISVGANYTKLWKAPVIWWEYGGMTASRAAACLG